MSLLARRMDRRQHKSETIFCYTCLEFVALHNKNE
ncbi:unnamed protein product [Tenebrio molitor]|nr:unnamed protein product [Tenebrio molitor]